MKAYREKDFTPEFNHAIAEAKDMWRVICKENFADIGDVGSCVVGAGIEINYIPKGCRKARRKQIISSHDVAQCQGSINWEHGHEKVVDFLKFKGIDCAFNWGRMD